MTPENAITTRTLHRLQDVGHRAADRRRDPGGAMLLAVHPGPPSDAELVTPDVATGRVFRSPPGSGDRGLLDEVDPTGSIRSQGRAIGVAYRRVFGTYAALGEGLASGFRGDTRPVADVPDDELRGMVADVVDRAQDEEGRR